MRYRLHGIFCATLAAVAAPAFAAEELLQNDGFVDGGVASFQAGFIATEVAASRFVPTIDCPCVIESVTVLYGGTTGQRDVQITIWDDPTGVPTPGAPLFTGDVTLTGSNIAFNEIDVSSGNVTVNGPFRIGLEFQDDGLPSIATDIDGTVDASANFILANVGGLLFWFASPTLGVSGDFILRARVDNLLPDDTDEDGVPDDIDNCTNVVNPLQEDADADSYGNACDTDLDASCVTNAVDLGLLRLAFFSTPGGANWNGAADFNSDGVVNVVDLGIMRAAFFSPPGPSGLTDLCD